MELFRLNDDQKHMTFNRLVYTSTENLFDAVLDTGVIELVEPCEHGNYDGHFTEYDPIKDRKLDGHWCRGAALGCNCEACSSGPPHRSDCAVHNEPAFPNGPCDCGAESFVALLVPANEKKSNER